MNFSIETGDLQKAIKLLGVSAKVNTKDSTGLVLIGTENDGSVTFLANNISTSIAYNATSVLINTPGTIALEYGKIRTFISAFSPLNDKGVGVKDFKFDADDRELIISLVNHYENGKVSNGELKLPLYDPYSVKLPKPFTNPNFVLNSTIFRSASSKILYSVDPSADRPFIQGMNITFDKDNIYFVGTNGKVLSEYQVKNISDLQEGTFLIRYDFIMGLRRALGEETNIGFEIDNRDVVAKFDNVTFGGKVIIGHEYPAYRQIFDSPGEEIIVDKNVLMSSLLPLSDILDPDDNYRLTLELEDGVLKFSNYAVNFVYNEKIDFSGKFVIDLNGLYMTHTVDAIKDDKIIMKFSDSDKPLIFDSGNFRDQQALVTPLKRR